MTKFRGALSCGVALGALLAAGGALAGDFTVESGDTETSTQEMLDPDDVGLIEAGGAISTINGNELGVSMENANQTVTNDGDVTTLGTSAFGISSQGADARINNNGDITTSGFAADGIFSLGADARIANSGNITTSNVSADGINTAGENAQINNSGAITTSDGTSRGIVSTGGYVQIANTGDITTSGSSSYGIVSSGTDAQINNSGDIVTSGLNGFGIHSFGEDAQIANSGNITTSGTDGYGIYSRTTATNAQIDNSGDIATSGATAYGIFSAGADALITNSGDITTSGGGAHAIQSTGQGVRITNSSIVSAASGNGMFISGADGQITNSGNISGTGGAGIYVYDSATNIQITNSGGIWGTYTGIHAQGNDARITNSGGISGNVGVWVYGFADNVRIANSGRISGNEYGVLVDANTTDALIINSGTIMTPDGQGIVSLGAAPTVTNSGRIISSLNTYAIFFAQQNATLNLLAGSVIQGGIGFSNAEVSATLNIGPGLNMVMSFADVPGTINTFGAPMVVQGPLVAVVDPTGFSAQDEMLTDLTRAIANAVDGRINAARFGYVPPATPLLSYAEADGPADAVPAAFGYPAGTAGAASPGYGFWASGIGAYRNQDADGPDVGFDTGLGGLLVGYDTEVSAGTRVGGFLGASASRFETDANSQEIDADSYFGGVYGSYSGQTYFLDASLTGGVTQQSSDRTVANNLVIGGIEHAKADYDGVFVSPSATIGTTYAMSGGTLIPSFRARYAGLFLDGYEEHGSAADMTVDDRDVNVFDFRAQLAYALAAEPLNGGMLHTALRFGADATFADNDDVEAVLLGTGLNFSVSGDDTLRGFAGLDMSWRAAGGADFFLGAEAGYDSGDAFTLDVQGGLRIPL